MSESAWITRLRADGSPRSVRVWFAPFGDERWIATSLSTRAETGQWGERVRIRVVPR